MKTKTIREAIAVFDEPDALEDAISDLQSSGVDRADLSILALASAADPRSGSDVRVDQSPAPARGAVVSDTDLRQGRVLATGGVGIASTVIGRQLANEHTTLLDAQRALGGIRLWVHPRDPKRRENRARSAAASLDQSVDP